MTLSPRLEALFRLLLPDHPVWDVGYDHGQLGLFALASGKFPQVNFVDPVEKIAVSLQAKLSSKNFSETRNQASIHVCNLSDLSVQVDGSLVFAGVGANNILTNVEVLVKESKLNARRLVLSPHRDAKVFCEKSQSLAPLFIQKYKLAVTQTVIERGRTRYIYVFELNT